MIKKLIFLLLLIFIIVTILYFNQDRNKVYILEHYNKKLNTYYFFCGENRLCKIVTPKKTISYTIDKNNYRIKKFINGKLIEKYFWLGAGKLHLVTDKNSNILREYLYKDEHIRLPYGVKIKEEIYNLIYNKMGSLRVITDKNGHIVKVLYYDKKGLIIKDTNPVMRVDFAYDGGVWDKDARLLFFQEGVYDPLSSKWISKVKKLDIVKNLKELNGVDKDSVYICNATLDTYYHSYICAQNQCGGLYAAMYMHYFNAKGFMEDNSRYFNKDICKEVKLTKQYDKNLFAKCVYEKIIPKPIKYFDVIRHNCHDEVKDIVKICKKQAKKEFP